MIDRTTGGFALDHVALTAPPVHIPDGWGGAFKTELVLERSPERTVKLVWWHAPDPRPDPHNHPWRDEDDVSFRSTILHGGYTEQIWVHGPDGVVSGPTTRTHRAGDVNTVRYWVFHNVVDVLPGTVTRMECGPLAGDGGLFGFAGRGAWGYWDLEARRHVQAQTEPGFAAALQALNPHLRP